MVRVSSLFSQLLHQFSRSGFASMVKNHAEYKAKGLTCWNQFVAMMFCPLAGAESLREINNGLKCCLGKIRHLGVFRQPNKSTLSYANNHRPADFFQDPQAAPQAQDLRGNQRERNRHVDLDSNDSAGFLGWKAPTSKRKIVSICAVLLVLGMGAPAASDALKSPEVPFGLETLAAPSFPDRQFPVTDFGGIGDGKHDNTEAFGRAIRACSSAGGGRVVVPAGKWHTGPIHLKSNVNLHLEKGAEIIFSADPSDYLPLVFTRWEGVECYSLSPLVYGRGLENVAITGKGVLNGRGEKWWSWKSREQPASDRLRTSGEKGTPLKERRFGPEAYLRPPLVQLVKCKNVLLENYTAKNAPFWTNHLVYCQEVMVRGIRVEAPAGSPNTDGINLDSTRRAIVREVFISTGDDAVSAKSGRDRDGRQKGIPTEDVLIEDCHVQRAHGGFVIGSEMSGGVRNVLVRDCFYNGAQRGVRLKSRMGKGGYMKNIRIENLSMKKITGPAITVNLFYDPHYPPGDPDFPPQVDGVHISGLRCKSARRAVLVRGLPDAPVRDFTLTDVKIGSVLGAEISEAEGVKLDNVMLTPLLPPVVKAHNVRGLEILNSQSPPALVYLSLSGEDSREFFLRGNDLDKALMDVRAGSEVPHGAVHTSQ